MPVTFVATASLPVYLPTEHDGEYVAIVRESASAITFMVAEQVGREIYPDRGGFTVSVETALRIIEEVQRLLAES